MLRHLKSGDGLFSGLKAARSPSGPFIVCGWVRQRDYAIDYPSYPLNRPFAVSYSQAAEGLADFRMVYFANEKDQSPPLYSFCAQRGIPL